MSASTAIGRASESLRNLLLGEMQLTPSVPVTVLAPDEQGQNRRINLFLYRVLENTHLKNQEWQVKSSDTSQLQPPPLSLNLYYLLTPYASNDQELGNATQHEILGEAMRVFYEHSVVPDTYLAGDLGWAREEMKIIQNGIDMEELSQVWGTFAEPFRLSILYEVSVVQLDASTDRERALPERVRTIGPPRVEQPYQPPVVDEMAPTQGPAGTTVTFTGHHLDGWQATVSVLQQRLVDERPITGNTFDASLPGDLEPGFYEIRIEVSNLFRSTFFFEVLP